ncbi:hypothetical protein A2U01_0106241, partial [Trifolium medium]|nr:hypothetical protein [Trifolium medium]
TSVIPSPSVPGNQAATRASIFATSDGSKTKGLPDIRITSVGILSATKLIISVPLKGIVSFELSPNDSA